MLYKINYTTPLPIIQWTKTQFCPTNLLSESYAAVKADSPKVTILYKQQTGG